MPASLRGFLLVGALSLVPASGGDPEESLAALREGLALQRSGAPRAARRIAAGRAWLESQPDDLLQELAGFCMGGVDRLAIEALARRAVAPPLEPAPAVRRDARWDFEAVLAAGEGFDLASASLLLMAPDNREVTLARLDRLSRFLAGRLRGVDDPDRIVEVLNRWLLRPRGAVRGALQSDDGHSRLDAILERDAAGCLGYTLLYLAVAERLDLPLFGVATPYHCFVRWDDGRHRRNIETTAGGEARPDAAYVDRTLRAAPELLERKRYLVNLTRRQVLAALLVNRAAAESYHGRYRDARRAADRALQLDPEARLAWRHRAIAVFHTDLGGAERVRADLERALELHPGDAKGFRIAGELLLGLGRPGDALVCFERALELEPTRRSRADRIVALARLGEPLPALPAPGDSDSLRLAVLEARIRRAPGEAAAILRELGGPVPGLRLRVEAARVLLALPAAPAAEALALLDEFPGEEASAPDVRTQRDALLVRARALALARREDEARAALDAARPLWGSCRDLLEVERILAPRAANR